MERPSWAPKTGSKRIRRLDKESIYFWSVQREFYGGNSRMQLCNVRYGATGSSPYTGPGSGGLKHYMCTVPESISMVYNWVAKNPSRTENKTENLDSAVSIPPITSHRRSDELRRDWAGMALVQSQANCNYCFPLSAHQRLQRYPGLKILADLDSCTSVRNFMNIVVTASHSPLPRLTTPRA